MPRVNNVYEPPPGTYGASGTPILSNRYNTFVDDIAADLNAARPITAGGTGASTVIGGHDALMTKGADIASAATLNLNNATGYFVDVTGNTGITAVTLAAGRQRIVRFTGTPLITVGAILVGNNGGQNIQVEAGDMATFEGYAGNVVRFWLIKGNGVNGNIVSNDAGAGIGPTLTLFRDSASPAVSDFIGAVDFTGKDSAGNTDTYSRISSQILNAASASESSGLSFHTMTSGNLNAVLLLTSRAYFAVPAVPLTNDGAALGTTAFRWSDLLLADGAVVNWPDVNLEHSAGSLSLVSTDAGASPMPMFNLYRDSASPAATDDLGMLQFEGKTSTGVKRPYVQVYSTLVSPTNGSEEGKLTIRVRRNGGLADRFFTFSASGFQAPVINGTDIGVNTPATGYFTFVDVGTFSASGATDGKTISNINISSSRSISTLTYHLAVYNPNGLVGGVQSNGSATVFNTSSDERLKNFIGPFDPLEALAIIRADPTRKFTWLSDGSLAVGWGAQTSYAVSPDLASPGVGAPGDEDYVPWGVDQGKRTPYLWAVVPWFDDRITALEARLSAAGL